MWLVQILRYGPIRTQTHNSISYYWLCLIFNGIYIRRKVKFRFWGVFFFCNNYICKTLKFFVQLLYLLILRCLFFPLIFMPLNLGHILQSKGNHNLIDNFFSFLVVTADWSLICSKSSPSLCLHALCNVTLLTCHQTGRFPQALKMGWSHLYLFLKRALLVPYTFPFALTHFSLPDFQKHLHFFAPGPSPAAKARFACCDGLKICSHILWPSSLLSSWMWARLHDLTHVYQMECGRSDNVILNTRS